MFSVLMERSLELLHTFSTSFESLYHTLFDMDIGELIESSFGLTPPDLPLFDMTVISAAFGAGLVTLVAFILVRFLLDVIP
jgi:hypothetical protein